MHYLKTTILFAILTGIIVLIGYFVGGENGALLALIFSAILNFGSYWFSDRIVLSMYKAKKLEPSEKPELHSMIQELIIQAQMPMPRLYLVEMATPNAFATGRSENNAVIAVTTGLLTNLNSQEIKGVLAHELSHIKNKDMLISSIAATLAGTISYLAQLAYFAGGDEDEGVNPIALLIMLILAPILGTLIHLGISRAREYLADETGAKIARDTIGLANALEKLHKYSKTHPIIANPKNEATAHLFIVNPFKGSFLSSLFSTHPPIEERISRLKNLRLS